MAESPAATPLARLLAVDAACSLHIHTLFQPLPRVLLKVLEISGDGRLWFLIPVAVFLSSFPSKSPHLRWLLLSLLRGLLLDILVVGLLKFLVRRPRPVYNKGMHLTVAVDHWSFPSGHSSRVFFIAYFLSLSSTFLEEAVAQFGGGDVAGYFVKAAFLWSGTTSASRVLLGRHFVLDVIAGACLGVLEALIAFWVVGDLPMDSSVQWQKSLLR